MISNPLVSCVIPVFNGERFLEEAVASVTGQTYQNIEIIVVDDASADNTAGVARRLSEEIQYYRLQTELGPPGTRNFGASKANGEFLAFLDGDDVWLPEKIEKQLTHFENKGSLDVSVTQIQNFWMPELDDEYQRLRQHPRAGAVAGYISGTMLVHMNYFHYIGPFDTNLFFGDAAEWFLRAQRKGAVVEMLPEVLVRHRLHSSNLTRRRADDSKLEFIRIARSNLEAKKTRQKDSKNELVNE